ncbi:MAG: hypothetical protein C4548_04615 [Desulfobacteraceae bacterium]|jgi:hypothetical protein|nr:MAG: hypothetical protein C4548_04615 [Desulfobacteraceae bacterium]
MIKKMIVLTIVVLLVGMAGPAHATWFIYAKPKFLGRVINLETREPITGAVVAVYYTKRPLFGSNGPAEIIYTTEVMTDKRGQFVIEPFRQTIGPFAITDIAEFIIYKPGYASYPEMFPLRINPEIFFSTDKVGVKGVLRQDDKAVPFTYGVLELRALKTSKKRIYAIPVLPDGIGEKDFPELKRLIAQERRHLGLEGSK